MMNAMHLMMGLSDPLSYVEEEDGAFHVTRGSIA